MEASTETNGFAPANSADSDYHQPSSLEELTQQNIATIVKLDDAASAHRTAGDRAADFIAGFCGSVNFVWVHVAWFGCWVVVNSWRLTPHFDPFPFTFLTLVVSLEAIFLSAFIMISQNHSARQSERRNHLDLQINLLAEQENTKMLNLLKAIAEKVGVEKDPKPTNEVLEQITRPEKLIEQIDCAIERGSRK